LYDTANAVYAASAYPAGIALRRFKDIALIGLAMPVLEMSLAFAAAPWHVFAGAGLWGLHMGFTQGLFSKLVADSSPVDLRGTAFGIFNLVSGVALLLASVVAGSLWDLVGPSATFITGAIFAALAAIGVFAHRVIKSA
jgi:MFS family permease